MEDLQFAQRGHRKKEGFGLVYMSACKRYRLYLGDMVGFVRWEDHGLKPRWYANRVEPDGRVLHTISWHRSRERAIAACKTDLRKQSKFHPKMEKKCKTNRKVR